LIAALGGAPAAAKAPAPAATPVIPVAPPAALPGLPGLPGLPALQVAPPASSPWSGPVQALTTLLLRGGTSASPGGGLLGLGLLGGQG
ncbi:MAG: hypothetical protein QOG45_391, partial [Chloroflexota bacterium]|nr:hypothetical protein [Chloroflexota bacterium]